uniref:Uncharacterized protein n=1 Tax=Hemileccinum impolitum TaxID=121045 RepID=A0A8F0WII1_9AGAM|nr:hypothetical protein KYX09_mgp13 [Xerocomus impolitus]QWM94553.1 hypothetical protein [Xerocomus impolitus]QWM97185.1 hypothetical protein [Xerocomus impolitus]UHB41860.1 hypothetical protein [Xerocomus impolitus]
MNTNIQQLYKKMLKNLSVLGVSLSIYNTITSQTTVQALRDNLESEKDKNSKLITEINNLVSENESNSKIESIIRKSFENNETKIEMLSNKINSLIETKSLDEIKIIEVNNAMKDLNKDLIGVIDKIDETLKSSIIDSDILNYMISHINSLNYFQSLAISHLFLIILISILLIDLMTIYFGDYFLDKFNIKDKYPRIFKIIELRRKFQKFYLIKDLVIIFLALIALAYINIKLFLMFSI